MAGSGSILKKKPEDELFSLMDQDEVVSDVDPGLAALMDADDDVRVGPNESNLDPEGEAPWNVRMEVGALEKPEDKLVALRKTYPDAQPTKDGSNFMMTNPETGKTIMYNRESWNPLNLTAGDFASIAPEIGEIGGGIGGAVGGGIGGAAVGSAVPVLGTAAGGVAGGIAGAGTGAVAGREGVQRGLNYLFGNEDTRTGSEQLTDAAKTFALNAAGEGAGMAVAKGAGALYGAGKRFVVGEADDAAKAAQRATDLRAIGAEPTAGMVNGNARIATKEHALAATNSGKRIQERISQAFDAQGDEHLRVVDGLTGGRGAASKQELGEALQGYAQRAKEAATARSDELYGQTAQLTQGVKASGDNIGAELKRLQGQRKLLGKSAELNQGKAYDDAIRQASAIVEDVGKGADFNTLKQARTSIRELANDPGADDVLKTRLNSVADALTKDMEATASAAGPDALQAWRKANNQFRRRVADDSIFNEKQSIDPILKMTPDKVHDYVLAQSTKGGTRLQAIRRQIEKAGGQEAWDDLAGNTVLRMGRQVTEAGESVYNPTRMFNEWSRLSPEAKDALFKGTSRAQYRQDMDRLARVAENWKPYQGKANHSNTASHQSALAEMNPLDRTTILGALFAGPTGAATAIAGKTLAWGGRRYQAALLADPEVVNRFAGFSRASVEKGGTRKFIEGIASLAKTAANPATRTALDEYLREINYQEKAWER
ncbi:Hypothetical protein NGAL_HAMBI490_42860 [Neorhizobium galegae bv. officinalis]|nr:Hypothetical protein NGAL_HAMBI490_42860 [Neorhizobium galegae bv. officinalis]